jgi:hypothetical protein
VDAEQAIKDALPEIHKALKRGILGRLLMLVWCAALAAFMAWPILFDAMIPELRWALLGTVGLAAVVVLLGIPQGLIGLIKLKSKSTEKFCTELRTRKGPEYQPSMFAFYEPRKISPKAWVPFVVLILAVLLNCIVPASFARPAVIGPEVTTSLTFVPPWQRWSLKQRFMDEQILSVYFAPDENDIWCVDLRLTIRLTDPVNEPIGWRRWVRVMLDNMVDRATNAYIQAMETGLAIEQVRDALTEIFLEPEIQAAIIKAFSEAFNAKFGALTFPIEIQGSLRIQQIDITARHVPMSEYREYIEKREK